MIAVTLRAEPCDDETITCVLCWKANCSHQIHFGRDGRHSVLGLHEVCGLLLEAQAKARETEAQFARNQPEVFEAAGEVDLLAVKLEKPDHPFVPSVDDRPTCETCGRWHE